MKPRSTVRALLAVTESLLAARTKAATARAASTGLKPRAGRVIAALLGKSRLLLPIKPQTVS